MKRLAFLLVFAVSACAGTNFDWSQVRTLKVGMNQSEVEAIMGRPYLVRSTPDGLQWTWSHANLMTSTRVVSVLFKEGKLAQVPEVPDSFR